MFGCEPVHTSPARPLVQFRRKERGKAKASSRASKGSHPASGDDAEDEADEG